LTNLFVFAIFRHLFYLCYILSTSLLRR